MGKTKNTWVKVFKLTSKHFLDKKNVSVLKLEKCTPASFLSNNHHIPVVNAIMFKEIGQFSGKSIDSLDCGLICQILGLKGNRGF